MKEIYIGLATFPGREESVRRVIDILTPQCTQLFLYDNGIEQYDATDNGKFWGLTQVAVPGYYLTVDDDLLYAPDYVQNFIADIDRHKCICSHHGRILNGLGLDYYRGHRPFRCLGEITEEIQLDIPGTGVCGWDMKYFNPVNLWKSEDKKMSDLVFALEATKQNKKIMLLKHERGYITHLPIDHSKTIHSTEKDNCTRQNTIADNIWNLKHTN